MRGIVENKMSGFFANSFFIEVSEMPKNFSNVKYVKFQNQRSDDYKIMTIIEDNLIKKYTFLCSGNAIIFSENDRRSV